MNVSGVSDEEELTITSTQKGNLETGLTPSVSNGRPSTMSANASVPSRNYGSTNFRSSVSRSPVRGSFSSSQL